MTWDDPTYANKVQKLERLFAETGHGIVSDYLDRSYGAPAQDAPFTKAHLFTVLLSGTPTPEVDNYIDGKLKSLRHLRDKRTPRQYAVDLVTGWLVEDITLLVLQDIGLEPALSGEDRLRDFLRRPTEAPDLRIHLDGVEYLVDIMKDDKGTWGKYDKLHLRDNKYFRLRDAGALLIALDLHGWRFAVLDITAHTSRHVPSHWPYGNKPAQELDLSATNFVVLDTFREELLPAIRLAIGRRHSKKRTRKR